MGFQLTISGTPYEMVSFSVQEASTPLAAGDTSGQVGTFNLEVVRPDLNAVPLSDPYDPSYPGDPIPAFIGPRMLQGRDVRLTDTRKGFTIGTVTSVDIRAGGLFSLTCESRLGLLNIYDVQAAPFDGTLRDAFSYYLSLAGVSTDLLVDPAIEDMRVTFVGWYGELWLHLKQMAAAIDADISLVSGVVVLRPIRVRVASPGREVDSTHNVSGSLAQSVEVYKYNTERINQKIVYPPNGWNDTVTVLNVNAGEYVEESIDLGASIWSIDQPVMQTFVAQSHVTSSVYTVVGNDGLPITPAAWVGAGGSLSVVINPDTISVTVRIQAPTSPLPSKSGEPIGVYSIALASGEGTGMYSTLRLVGSGVKFDKELLRFPTGVPASQTGTEVGVTIDNPFLSSTEQVFRAGSRAARSYTGQNVTLNATVVSVNQLGDSGASQYATYDEVEAKVSGTYNSAEAMFPGKTYDDIIQKFMEEAQSEFANQVFGNVSGSRIWDETSKRFYRIRNATLTPSTIQVQGDDDNTYDDLVWAYRGMTYNDVMSQVYPTAYMTYHDALLAGIILPQQDTSHLGLFPSSQTFPGVDVFPVKVS